MANPSRKLTFAHLERIGGPARAIGGVLMLVVSAYSAWALFSRPTGPVTELIEDLTTVDGGDLNKPIRYRLAYHKHRTDCPVSERIYLLTDSTGAQFRARSSKGRSGAGSDKTPDHVEAEYQVQLLTVDGAQYVALGPASIGGIIVYSCKEGDQTIRYPTKPLVITAVPSHDLPTRGGR